MGNDYALVLKEIGPLLITSAASWAPTAVAIYLISSALLEKIALIEVQLFLQEYLHFGVKALYMRLCTSTVIYKDGLWKESWYSIRQHQPGQNKKCELNENK